MPDIPAAPPWLADNSRALEKWNSLWSVVERTRVKPAVHGDWVAQYCIYYADMRDAFEKMRLGKLVKETRTVGVGAKAKTTVEKYSVSPYQSIYDNAVRGMERLGKMIGLDPVNPLDEARQFSDYAGILYEDSDDDVDDGSGGSEPGDAGGSAESEVPANPTGAAQAMDA